MANLPFQIECCLKRHAAFAQLTCLVGIELGSSVFFHLALWLHVSHLHALAACIQTESQALSAAQSNLWPNAAEWTHMLQRRLKTAARPAAHGRLTGINTVRFVSQAVHGGSDLRSAAANVLGFQQESMKGTPVTVEPVPKVATPGLRRLLELCASHQGSAQQVLAVCPDVCLWHERRKHRHHYISRSSLHLNQVLSNQQLQRLV